MNKPKANLLLYVVLLAVVLYLCISYFTPDSGVQVDYSTVRTLFQEEKVRAFTVKDGVLTLTLREPDKDGNTAYEHKLADEEMFREELSKYYLAQADAGVIERFNFVPTAPTPWYLQLLPYFLMLGVIAGLMMMQPHLSGTILILLIGLTLVFVGGAKLTYLGGAGLAGCALLIAVILLKKN